jgi:hypothetical protein
MKKIIKNRRKGLDLTYQTQDSGHGIGITA